MQLWCLAVLEDEQLCPKDLVPLGPSKEDTGTASLPAGPFAGSRKINARQTGDIHIYIWHRTDLAVVVAAPAGKQCFQVAPAGLCGIAIKAGINLQTTLGKQVQNIREDVWHPRRAPGNFVAPEVIVSDDLEALGIDLLRATTTTIMN